MKPSLIAWLNIARTARTFDCGVAFAHTRAAGRFRLPIATPRKSSAKRLTAYV